MVVLALLILLLVHLPTYDSEGGTRSCEGESRRGVGRTIVVDAGGNGDTTNLYDAVKIAVDGDTIYVRAGVYDEQHIYIDKVITITGEGENHTISTTPGENDLSLKLIVRKNWVNISGLTLDTSNRSGGCIELRGADNCSIKNNTFISKDCAVSVEHSENVVIMDNEIIRTKPRPEYSHEGALHLESCSNCSLERNVIGNGGISLSDSTFCDLKMNEMEAGGISLLDSAFCDLKMNEMEVEGIIIEGESSLAWESHSIEPSNLVCGKPIQYLNGKTGITVPPGAGQIMVLNCTNVTVEGQAISNCRYGIEILCSTNVTVRNNDLINNNHCGISLSDSSFIVIFKNRIDNSTYGISLTDSGRNGVYENIFTDNGCGIELDSSNGNEINNNTFSTTYNGIYLYLSDNNTIEANSIRCERRGLLLYYSVNNTCRNNVFENGGIYLFGGDRENWMTNNMSNNTLDGSPICCWIGDDNRTVPGDAGEVLLLNCSNITVSGLQFSSGGITLAFCTGCNVENNSFLKDSQEGITAYASDDIIIMNNSFIECKEAHIYVSGSENATIMRNHVDSGGSNGITVHFSGNSTIMENKCSYNDYTGIYFADSSNCTIANNICNGNLDSGMKGRSIADCRFYNNTCNDNDIDGVTIHSPTYYVPYFQTDNISIQNNTFYGNRKNAISIDSCTGMKLAGNKMQDSGLSIDSSYIDWSVTIDSLEIDSSNTVNGKPMIFWKNVRDEEVPFGAGQVILYNCTGVVVTGQTLEKTAIGIHLIYSRNCMVANNTCTNYTEAGIFLDGSIEIAIIGNTCNGNIMRSSTSSSYYPSDHRSCGILLKYSNTNTLIDNICIENGNAGISCSQSKDNVMVNNTCCGNDEDGISLGWYYYYNFGKEISFIRNNKCCSNGDDGINVRSQNANLSGNNCSGNMAHGISIERDCNLDVLNNTCDSNNISGIFIDRSGNYGYSDGIGLIEKNRCRFNNGSGIEVDAKNVRIVNNSCLDNVMNGMHLGSRSSKAHVRSNHCSWNGMNGIEMAGDDGRISDNRIEHNGLSGLFFGEVSDSRITSNIFVENGRYGIEADLNSSDNMIYGNRFHSNGNGTPQALGDGYNNLWSHNGSGNYWSDWTGPDDDWNYIVDLPYQLDGYIGNVDPHPIANGTTAKADAGKNVTAVEGSTVHLGAADSFADRSKLNYTWSFEYDGRMIGLTGPEVSFEFSKPGKYPVILTVSDENGTSSNDTMFVTIEESKAYLVTWGLAIGVALIVILVIVSRVRRKGRKGDEEGDARDGGDVLGGGEG